MSTLIVSNLGKLITGTRGVSDLLGGADAMSPPYDRYLQVQSHRTAWLAVPGDVIVVPTLIDQEFLDYATSLRGFRSADVAVLAPRPGQVSGGLAQAVRRVINEKQIDQVWPYYFDRTTAAFARSLGLDVSEFVTQGGAELLNSKILFRILASGIGVQIAEGRVIWSPEFDFVL